MATPLSHSPTTTINGIKYHAKYSYPSNLPLFKSSNDIHFRFSLDALAKWSPWFAEAVEKGTLPPGTEAHPIMLDKAGAFGLDLTFWAIKILEDSTPGVAPAPISSCPQNIVLIEFLDMLPVYSLQRVGGEIIGMVSNAELQAHKVEWLILAAASGRDDLASPARAFLPGRVDDQIHKPDWAQPYLDLYPHAMAALYQAESEWELLLNKTTVAVVRLLQKVQNGGFNFALTPRVTTIRGLTRLLAEDDKSFRAWAEEGDARDFPAFVEWLDDLGLEREINSKLLDIYWPLHKWLRDQ